MAVMTWRDRSRLEVSSPPSTTIRRTIRRAIVINLLNPKLTLFFFAFLPQFAGSGSGSTWRMLGLGAVFMVVTFVVFALYGGAAAAIRERVISNQKVLNRVRQVFAVSFLGLSVQLAVTSQ